MEPAVLRGGGQGELMDRASSEGWLEGLRRGIGVEDPRDRPHSHSLRFQYKFSPTHQAEDRLTGLQPRTTSQEKVHGNVFVGVPKQTPRRNKTLRQSSETSPMEARDLNEQAGMHRVLNDADGSQET